MNTLVTLVGSISLSCRQRRAVVHISGQGGAVHDRQGGHPALTGTRFCVTKTTESLPRTAMLVMLVERTALKAYSAAGSRLIG